LLAVFLDAVKQFFAIRMYVNQPTLCDSFPTTKVKMKRFLLMKSTFYFLIITLLLVGCRGSEKKHPDVSQIRMNVHIERFDKAYFGLDSNDLDNGLKSLQKQFPYFLNDFTENILGAGIISDTNKVLPIANRQFFTSYFGVYQSVKNKFADMSGTEKELNTAFRYVRYYFPKYEVPRFVSYFGPFDAPGVAITQHAIAIGLHLYAGRDFPYYTSLPGQEMYPAYISKRFEKEYIPVNCIKAVEEDLFPDKSQGLPLVEIMIEKGKYWWLEDLLLPEIDDSLKTGFTGEQLSWCKSNEGVVWNLLLQNDQLYSTDPSIIQTYIGDAPGTQGFPPVAPGNIGQWIGLQIVNTYHEKHPSVTPEQLMQTPAREILEGSKYKPR
jgi:hypothetical protein